MAFDFKNPYAPPGVYTESEFESNLGSTIGATNIPMLIGPGNEILSRINLEVVRGSSQTVDQRVPLEDSTGRAIGDEGLSDFDGIITEVKVRNFPIVTGDGNGRTSNSPADVAAFLNGEPTVVLSVDGASGKVELAVAPKAEDEVRITYFFNRTDTEQTDDLSSQATTEVATIAGSVGESFEIEASTADADGNDTFVVTVDGEAAEISIPAGTWTAAQVAGYINAAAPGSLEASTTINSEGDVVILLTADQGIILGDGLANATLGFTAGEATLRNTVFYTHQRPIVDGTNAGRTLTAGDSSGVLVTVDGEEVEVADVDGKTGAITLAVAPPLGSEVKATYFWNSWQDTFDFVFDIGVTRILRCGVEAGRMDYLNGTDFVLTDDKVHWGTSAIIESGVSTDGADAFGSSQITAQLADVKVSMEECAPVTMAGATSLTKFVLQRVPTSGNGTGSPGNEYPISAANFSSMTNKRRDVWSNRPELIKVYAGYGVEDAASRGQLTTAWVDATSKSFTLSEAIEPGMTVYASYYYNRVDDTSWTLECLSSGGSGFGTYSITSSAGDSVFACTLTGKGAGLVEVLQWESGNSNLPMARFESVSSDLYTGAVNEVVTVTLVDKDATPAKMSFNNPGPFYFSDSSSDSAVFNVDATANRTHDLSVGPAVAIMVSDAASYDASSGGTDWTIETGVNDSVSLSVDGATINATVAAGARTIDDFVTAINTAAEGVAISYTASTRIRNKVEIAVGVMDNFVIGIEDGLDNPDLDCTITAAEYANVGDLAAAVQVAIDTAIGVFAFGDPANAPTITVEANVAGQLVFTLEKTAAATAMQMSFVDSATELQSFAKGIAGIDTAQVKNTYQTILNHAPIAYKHDVGAGGSGAISHDRLVLRNRLIPGGRNLGAVGGASVHPSSISGAEIEVLSGTALSLFGLSIGDSASARSHATVIPAALSGYVGWGRGYFDPTDAALLAARGQAKVTFYDGTNDALPANDSLELTIDGTAVTVSLGSSADGTETALGPISDATSVLGQIDVALSTAGVGSLVQEGASFWISSSTQDAVSKVTVGEGSANLVLGLNDNESAVRSSVPASALVGSIMTDMTNANWVAGFDSAGSTSLPGDGGVALVVTDATGNDFLQVESGTAGTSSSISFGSASTIARRGSGFIGTLGAADFGEGAMSGFTVTSDNPEGSGSANSSILNSGDGQDGVVGQTYRDEVTGLTFTLLSPLGGGNYSTNATSTFELTCTDEIVCDANNPIESLAGLQLFVANTSSVAVGDTAIVTTYHKNGKEPSIGQSFFISYEYEKRNYTPRLFTKISTIEAAFGKVGATNQTSLASYLMFLNGASVIGVKQVRREEGKTNASLASYQTAVEELEGLLPGRIRPSVLVPLKEYSHEFGTFLSLHVDKQSNITNKAERTAILGFSAGTQPSEAATMVKMLDEGVDESGMRVSGNPRIRCVYPDMLTVSTTDALGNQTEELVDGRYLAAMMAARQLSPNRDAATPWTGTQFVGTNGVSRNLDTVTMNQVASAGITVCENRPPFIKVRQGLTTDMGTVMTKTPSVIQIADEVHQRSRDVLEGFIGVKFLPSIVSQIEGRVAMMYKDMVSSQIVAAYTGIKANVRADDPTACEVESFYQPIFPLLYIVMKFNIRSSV